MHEDDDHNPFTAMFRELGQMQEQQQDYGRLHDETLDRDMRRVISEMSKDQVEVLVHLFNHLDSRSVFFWLGCLAENHWNRWGKAEEEARLNDMTGQVIEGDDWVVRADDYPAEQDIIGGKPMQMNELVELHADWTLRDGKTHIFQPLVTRNQPNVCQVCFSYATNVIHQPYRADNQLRD